MSHNNNKIIPIGETNNSKTESNENKDDNHGRQWSNPIEFLMTCIGFAVGLGNVWRFPYLCFKNGGSAFVIVFVIMLFTVGLPLFFIEVTIAQYSKFGPMDVWKICPPLRGLGACSLLVAAFISLYYNVLICYSLVYLISSFIPKIPWTECSFVWNNQKCCIPNRLSNNVTNISSILYSGACPNNTESPAKQYFEKYVLNMSNGIEEAEYINWKLALSLSICWLIVFLSLSKGVESLGKVSYVTAIFPYIMIIALIVRGATLEGAYLGIKYFILEINVEKILSLQTWVDATTQVYFCLSICQGGLYTLGRHNAFNYNHQRTCVIVAVLDGLTGIMAGFAIFSVLGYMSYTTGIEVPKLAVGGPGLSFIVYPEALSLMPFPWIWCIFFFLMMITIGFGSILSLMECVLDTCSEIFKKKLNSTAKKTFFRFFACGFFFLVGLSMTTRASIYIQNLFDSYVSNYPVLICTALEAIGYGWFYGIKRIKRDIKLMLGFDPNYYWIACFLAFTPILTIATLVASIVSEKEVTLNDYKYPAWAHAIGWIVVLIILAPLPVYFGIALKNSLRKKTKKIAKFSDLKQFLYDFIQPDEDWKPVQSSNSKEKSSKNSVIENFNRQLETELVSVSSQNSQQNENVFRSKK